MKTGDYIILAIVLAILALIILWLIKRKKQCKTGCSSCPYSDNCKYKK